MAGIIALAVLAVCVVAAAMANALGQDVAGILGDDRNSLEEP